MDKTPICHQRRRPPMAEDLFVTRSRRLLTHHISHIISTTITTKNAQALSDEQAYNASYNTTQKINIV